MIETALYVDHVRRGFDYVTDQPLCRWVLARHARRVGRLFIHLEIEPS